MPRWLLPPCVVGLVSALIPSPETAAGVLLWVVGVLAQLALEVLRTVREERAAHERSERERARNNVDDKEGEE